MDKLKFIEDCKSLSKRHFELALRSNALAVDEFAEGFNAGFSEACAWIAYCLTFDRSPQLTPEERLKRAIFNSDGYRTPDEFREQMIKE